MRLFKAALPLAVACTAMLSGAGAQEQAYQILGRKTMYGGAGVVSYDRGRMVQRGDGIRTDVRFEFDTPQRMPNISEPVKSFRLYVDIGCHPRTISIMYQGFYAADGGVVEQVRQGTPREALPSDTVPGYLADALCPAVAPLGGSDPLMREGNYKGPGWYVVGVNRRQNEGLYAGPFAASGDCETAKVRDGSLANFTCRQIPRGGSMARP